MKRRLSALALFLLVFSSFIGSIVLTVPPPAVHATSGPANCYATSPYGTGADGNATLDGTVSPAWASKSGSTYTLTRNVNLQNLTILAGVALHPSTYTIYACLDLKNLGAITNNGPAGSAVSDGGTGSGTSAVTVTCSSSQSGSAGTSAFVVGAGGSGAAYCNGTGSATSGAGGGPGINGGNGVAGTSGGTIVIYTYNIDNVGEITVNGGAGGAAGDGGNGANGGAGSVSGTLADFVAAGGGGGRAGNGGNGARGGNGGTVDLYYGITSGSGIGTRTANPGSGGSAGLAGTPGSGGSGTRSGTVCSTESGGAGNSGGGSGGSVTSTCGASSANGSAGGVGSPGSPGSSGSSGTVVTQPITMVTQPYVIATPSGSSALTGTISGCSTNSTSFTTSATRHYLSVIDDCVLTFTMPAASSHTRGVFSSNSTSTTTTTCASGTCTTFTPPDYAQLQNTYQMTAGSSTWDSGYTEPVTGTLSGTAGTTLCSVTVVSGQHTEGYLCWADYDTAVSLVSQFNAATKGTWTASNSTSFTLTSGGNTKKTGYTFYAQATPATNSFGVSQTAVNTFTSATSCSVTLTNIFQGELVVAGVSAYQSGGLQTFQIGDALNTDWSAPISETANTGAENAFIWWGYFPASASSDAITMTFQKAGGGGGSGAGFCGAYHLFGMQSFTLVSAVGAATGTNLATSSLAFTGSPYIAISFASIAASVTWTAGTSYSIMSGSTAYGDSEYSQSVSSPTTFPLTSGSSAAYAYVGVVLSRGVSGANLYLQDSTTGLPFSIGGYQGSTAEIDYASGSPTYYKLNMSQTVVNLYQASEVKVWVGATYFVAVVPSSEPNAANITVYLAPPAQEVHYVITISDQTNQFLPGTEVIVYSAGRVYGSGYEAGDFTYSPWLTPGNYTITFQHDHNSYSTLLSAGASQAITIPIVTGTVTTPSSLSTSVFLWVGWNAALSEVQTQFNDTTLTTTQVNVTLYVFNSTCTAPNYCAVGYAQSLKGSYGYLAQTLPGNVNYANSYFVKYSVASNYLCPEIALTKTCTFGPVYVSTDVFPTAPVSSVSLEPLFGPGMADYIPNWVNGLSFLSYGIMVATALAFGRRYSWIALVAVAGEGSVLSALGWFGVGASLGPELLVTLGFTGVIGYMIMRERRGPF